MKPVETVDADNEPTQAPRIKVIGGKHLALKQALNRRYSRAFGKRSKVRPIRYMVEFKCPTCNETFKDVKIPSYVGKVQCICGQALKIN